MRIREPVVAGRFYSAEPDVCRADIRRMISAVDDCLAPAGRFVGGLVPHAGWTCSGQVAAGVFAALARTSEPDVIVLFGGVHRHRGQAGALFGGGRWDTPVGPVEIDERLAERVLGQTSLIVDDPYAHEAEHSIEVQLPFLVHVFPGVKIIPIMVPPIATAHEVGTAVGRTLKAYRYNAIVIGTTDLTHYGPGYGFVPKGIGEEAVAWAKAENDTRFINLVCRMRERDVVEEAAQRRNACSAGAVAATIAAVKTLGASTGTLLDHTTSAEVLADGRSGAAEDSVGYAGIVFS